jgi:hypothetical protein
VPPCRPLARYDPSAAHVRDHARARATDIEPGYVSVRPTEANRVVLFTNFDPPLVAREE